MGFREKMKEAYEDGKKRGAEPGSFKYRAWRQAEKRAIKKAEKQEFNDRIKQMKKGGISYCPKCKGASIQYVERRKRLSLTRGIIGAVLISPLAGAVGAVTSKKYKGFVKCLNCGHKWKMQ